MIIRAVQYNTNPDPVSEFVKHYTPKLRVKMKDWDIGLFVLKKHGQMVANVPMNHWLIKTGPEKYKVMDPSQFKLKYVRSLKGYEKI